MPCFHSFINRCEHPVNSPDFNSQYTGLSYGMLGHYQKYTPKPPNIAELKTALLSIWNNLPQEFTVRQFCHVERDFDCVLLQLVDILKIQFNTERAAHIHH